MRNKILFAAIFLLSSLHSYGACTTPVNPKKVVLFLDTNLASKEIEAAEKAACERGESFVAVPGKYGKQVRPGFMRLVLRDLARNNVAISSLVISGHDGGGYTMGPNGYIRKEDLVTIMKEEYRGKPQLLNQLHTVLMWGCYSSTPEEILDWKTMLPSVKVVGGFFGSAPSSRLPLNSKILHDLLVRSERLSSQTDASRLKAAVTGITDFGQTTGVVYVQPNCAPEGVVYSQTGRGNRFERLQDALQCTAADRKKLEFYSQVVQRYFNGHEKIPGWSDHGPLRDAYSYARQLEHCLRDGEFWLNPDRVGHLLFWNGIRNNFMENFRKEMTAGQNAFNALQVPKSGSRNQQDFAELLSAAKGSVSSKDILNMYDLPRDQIAFKLARLSPLINHPALRENPALAAKVAPLRYAWRLANSYLYRMEPKCMDFLPWHEHHPGRAPLARCR